MKAIWTGIKRLLGCIVGVIVGVIVAVIATAGVLLAHGVSLVVSLLVIIALLLVWTGLMTIGCLIGKEAWDKLMEKLDG